MKNIETDKIEYAKAVAQLKFSLIAPVVANTFTEVNATAYFKRISESEFEWPDGSKRKFAWQTVKDWYYLYTRHGIDGLYPRLRIDHGRSRVLTDSARQRIEELIEEFPRITGVMIHQKLISEGIITQDEASVDSVQRYIRNENLRNGGKPPKKERRAWEFAHSLDGYEADTCHTFYIFDESDNYRKTYLIAIIDNHSRMIVSARFFFNDNSINFQSVWKDAILRYGRSRVLILDNGSTFKNKSTNHIAASVGTQLIYNPPYSPEGKAVIERFFRTIKDRWLNADHGRNYHSLTELNSKLYRWIDEYNRTIHSSFRDDCHDSHTPLQRFMYDMKDTEPWKTVNKRQSDFIDWVDECFLHEEARKVNGDSTVVINNISFDVPSVYIGLKVLIRYDPSTYQTVYINDIANKQKIHLKRTDKIENGKTRRTELIY